MHNVRCPDESQVLQIGKGRMHANQFGPKETAESPDEALKGSYRLVWLESKMIRSATFCVRRRTLQFESPSAPTNHTSKWLLFLRRLDSKRLRRLATILRGMYRLKRGLHDAVPYVEYY